MINFRHIKFMVAKFLAVSFSLSLVLFCSSCAHQFTVLQTNVQKDIYETENEITDYTYQEPQHEFNNNAPNAIELSDLAYTKQSAHLKKSKSIAYQASIEENIESQASEYIKTEQFNKAFKLLIKHQDFLTYNRKISNQLILVSLKLEKFDYAINQIKYALIYESDPVTYIEKRSQLANTYYVAGQYGLARQAYLNLDQEQKGTAAKYLFMIGYQQNNILHMSQSLDALGDQHPDYNYFSILAANKEFDAKLTFAATERVRDLYRANLKNAEVILAYANILTRSRKFDEALWLLLNNDQLLSDYRQYHFIKSYIYFSLGDTTRFKNNLNATAVESKYENDISDLFIKKTAMYSNVYSKIFQEKQSVDYKINESERRPASQD